MPSKKNTDVQSNGKGFNIDPWQIGAGALSGFNNALGFNNRGAGSIAQGLSSIQTGNPIVDMGIQGASMLLNQFGYNVNEELKNNIQSNIAENKSFQSNASDWDMFKSDYNSAPDMLAWTPDQLVSRGWFNSSGGRSLINNLATEQASSGNWVNRSLANSADNIMQNNIDNDWRNFLNPINYGAKGGLLHTLGTEWDNGLTFINNGGTHEENPYQGVQVGVDPKGTPNLVEEGEVIWNDYVFSNRLKVPEDIRNKYKLGGSKKTGITFADAVEHVQKNLKEMPTDIIEKREVDMILPMLADIQEQVRQDEERKQSEAAMMAALQNPAMIQQLPQLLAAQQGQQVPAEQYAEQPMGMQEEIPMTEEQPMMSALGGKLLAKGGNTKTSNKDTLAAEAAKRGMTVEEFVNEILSNPNAYSESLRKKASYIMNGKKRALGGNLFGDGSLMGTLPEITAAATAGKSPSLIRIPNIPSNLDLKTPYFSSFNPTYNFKSLFSNTSQYNQGSNNSLPYLKKSADEINNIMGTDDFGNFTTFISRNFDNPYIIQNYLLPLDEAASSVKGKTTKRHLVAEDGKTLLPGAREFWYKNRTSGPWGLYHETPNLLGDYRGLGTRSLIDADAAGPTPSVFDALKSIPDDPTKATTPSNWRDYINKSMRGTGQVPSDSNLWESPYVDAALAMAGPLTGLFYNLRNKPDYSRAKALANRRIRDIVAPVIGDRVQYVATDPWQYLNPLVADSASKRRSAENLSSGNRGTAIANMLAFDRNFADNYGKTLSAIEANELAKKEKNVELNRRAQEINASNSMQAQSINSSNDKVRADLFDKSITMMDNIDARLATALQASLNSVFQTANKLRTDQKNRHNRDWLIRSGIFGRINERPWGWTEKEWKEYLNR